LFDFKRRYKLNFISEIFAKVKFICDLLIKGLSYQNKSYLQILMNSLFDVHLIKDDLKKNTNKFVGCRCLPSVNRIGIRTSRYSVLDILELGAGHIGTGNFGTGHLGTGNFGTE
jgi:hypothetical protein